MRCENCGEKGNVYSLDDVPLCLRCAYEIRIADLETALRELTEWCEDALDNQDACSDRGRECPMHDAHKDWSLAGLIVKAREVLPEQGEVPR